MLYKLSVLEMSDFTLERNMLKHTLETKFKEVKSDIISVPTDPH